MKKKIEIIALSIVFLLIGFISYKVIVNKINHKPKNEVYREFLRVKYLVMKKSKDNYNMDDVFPDHTMDFLTLADEYVSLKKDGNNYKIDLDKVANERVLNSVTDYVCAKNNYFGEKVDDCKYDKKNHEVIIPKKYFKKSKKAQAPVQIELLSRMTNKEIKTLPIKTEYKNVFNKKKTIKRNGKQLSFNINLSKKLNSKNLKIYVNDKLLSNKKNYKYNAETGKVEINLSPVFVKDVKIKYNDFIGNLFSTEVSALEPTGDRSEILYFTVETDNEFEIGDSGWGEYYTMLYSEAVASSETIYRNKTIVTGGNINSIDDINYLHNNYSSIFSASEGNANVTVGVTLSSMGMRAISGNPSTINTYGNCGHISIAYGDASNLHATSGTYWYHWIVVDKSAPDSSGYTMITVVYVMAPEYYYWTGTDSSSTTQQEIVAVMRFRYQDTVCGKVTKRVRSASTGEYQSGTPQAGAKFKLYTGCTNTSTGAGCTEVANSEKTTGSDGTVTYEDLSPGTTYYYHETEAPSGYYMDWPGYYELGTSASCTTNTTGNTPKQYCYKVKKVDANKKSAGIEVKLPGFTYKDSKTGSTQTTGSDGIATFLTGHDNEARTVTETGAASGYERSTASVNVTPVEMPFSENQDYSASKCPASPIEFTNWEYLINWSKEYEGNGKANGAKFRVKKGDQYVKVSGTDSVKDKSGVTKTCYVYSGLTSNKSEASVLTSGANGEAGGVCISKIPNDGTYKVIETQPAANHTYSNEVYKNITASTSFYTDKIFKNKPTEVEITKTVTDQKRVHNDAIEAILNQLETLKLKKIKFNVYKVNGSGAVIGNPLQFVYHDGIYDLASAADVSGTATTTVYLNDNRKIRFKHLEWGDYAIVEEGNADGACRCEGDTNCIGYYFPEQSSRFTVTKCSSQQSASASTVNGQTEETTCASGGIVTKTVDNHPTYINFTKKDFYGYEDPDDVVDFVDDGERSAFDGITFKVKDEQGNYLKFVEVGTHITDSSKVCLNDNDYREYRYITDAEIQALGSLANQLTITTDLHTCGGHIRITNLCRGKKYKVEEASVPEDSVFVLEDTEDTPTAEYTIPCCEDSTTPTSSTKIIEDKGTRVRFEKRDSRYNYLIPDETTTFKVYQCEKGVECHPTDNMADMEHATGVRKMMKFSARSKLTRKDQEMIIEYDEEDGSNNGSVIKHTDQLVNGDKDYEAQYEVYRAMSDSDIAAGKQSVTDLHPDHGILILRYLPSGYNYVLVETVSPKGYSLPTGRNAETRFNIVNNTVKVEELDVPNKPVSLLIRKYDEQGRTLLEGAQFKIHEAKNCNFNVDPDKVETVGTIKLKTIRDGLYEKRPELDTEIIKTCTDKPGEPCNAINSEMTYSKYENTVGDFDTLLNDRNEHPQIEAGEALVQYLDYGKCYVIEEVKAPKGHSLPEKEKDRFTLVKMTDRENIVDTFEEFKNKPTPFTFYKYDEYNKPLDGAKYKLQKLDDNKVYHDVGVTKETGEDGGFYYKVDENSDNYILETTGGKATVYYLEEGQYRIIEVEAPEGYELPKKTMNVATFFVDNDGRVYGSNIIANKPATPQKEVKPEAQAKLILNIQTGQTIVRYGLIFAVLALAIGGLIFVQRKNKK